MLLFKLGPIYVEHRGVVAGLNALNRDPDWAGMPKEGIVKSLQKRWEVNDVNHVNGSHVKIEKYEDGVDVEVAYEVREHLLANVDVVLSFQDSIHAVVH
jgi:hypothetical protein